jgi:Cu/Ag efflux pump CusA
VLKNALQLPRLVWGRHPGFVFWQCSCLCGSAASFCPTLDEGDIMMHGFCKPGTSLTQTIASHDLAQKVILENFPDEVEQVISAKSARPKYPPTPWRPKLPTILFC